jgi:hypothetical protein
MKVVIVPGVCWASAIPPQADIDKYDRLVRFCHKRKST